MNIVTGLIVGAAIFLLFSINLSIGAAATALERIADELELKAKRGY